ncbi:hypothetical protein ElyMa_001758000 [Elysia marginata]|uniref:Uncharacterized protein n=1 Tax=Elysia marginata TaxID=1093978 RepID=A0AAV4EBE7_9GAST|nr:hypothetical protein ElyMa_001758000 [Elysia marginata]
MLHFRSRRITIGKSGVAYPKSRRKLYKARNTSNLVSTLMIMINSTVMKDTHYGDKENDNDDDDDNDDNDDDDDDDNSKVDDDRIS